MENAQAAGETSLQPEARPQINEVLLTSRLLADGAEILDPFCAALEAANEKIATLVDKSSPQILKKVHAVKSKLAAFEPNVTLVGQVKAGKTALTNVMAGNVGLLPSDVNPWTSVVTTLHLNSISRNENPKANFQFFDRAEWDALIEGGGRLGQLADRAGASDELEVIRAQIEEMRQRAQQRLGSKFEALLGKTHKYNYCEPELVERYVCIGDPDEVAEDPGV